MGDVMSPRFEHQLKIIETSILIRASADRVWMILTGLESYVDWNPFVIFAKGPLIVGQHLQIHRITDFYAGLNYGTVTAVNRGDYTLSWTISCVTPRLLNTIYHFTIEPHDAESVCLTQRETLSGLIPMIVQRSWLNTLQSYMVSENKALKRFAEDKQHRLPHLWSSTT
jgi:hypothetical protein